MKTSQTAFVTGGAEGIGAAVVHSLAAEGYAVYFCDKDHSKGEERLNMLRKAGLDAFFFKLDVGDPNDWKEVSEKLLKSGISLDLLVNNAGIADPFMEFPSKTDEAWNRIIITNLNGMFHSSNFLVPLMNEGACILNIASTRAYQSERNTLPYSASKGGVVAFTHSLALTLSERRIRVNSISPGWIDTSKWHIPVEKTTFNSLDHLQHPSGRIGKPEDVANLILFLASKKAEWINGQDIVIDGGMTKRMIYFDREVMEDAIFQLTGDKQFSAEIMDKAFSRKFSKNSKE